MKKMKKATLVASFKKAFGRKFSYALASMAFIVTINQNLSAQSWLLAGNATTNPPTDFIGTTDSKDLVFKTNGTEYMRLTSAGKLGIGTTTPSMGVQANVTNFLLSDPTQPTRSVAMLSNLGTTGDIPNGSSIYGGSTTSGEGFSLYPVGTGNTGVILGAYAYNQSTWKSVWETKNVSSGNPNFIVLRSGGKMGIGTTSPGEVLTVAGNVAPSADNTYTCGTSGARWSAVWSANGTIQTSDLRYKTNVADLKYGIKDIMKLRPVSYVWRENANGTRLGLIAQELQQVISEVVIEGNDENKRLGVTYAELIPVLIKGIQEQQTMISNLENAIQTLKANSLTGMNNAIPASGQKLLQNAPNPFTESTTINYELGSSSNAFIYIYDMQGKQVKSYSLLGKENSLTIGGNELEAGMYIYSLVSEGKLIDTKRMILTK